MTAQEIETIARRAIADIANQFPHLMSVEDENGQVEISITYPVQLGLKQEVWLALQNNDELHLSAGNFWLEWFPCTKPEKVQSYVESVTGFLSGRYRIWEHYRGGKCVMAELQEPAADAWNTVGTWSQLCLPWPWRKTFREVRNV